MGKKKYLQITFGDGIIHEYSKTQKEGFEPSENGKGFRKNHFRGLYGRYNGATITEGNFGKQIIVEMLDIHGDTNLLYIPLFNQDKSIGVFAEAFITYLPYLTIGYDYRIYAYSMEQPGTTYQKKGISIKFANLQSEEVYEEDQYKIPRLTYTYRKKTGEFVQGHIPEVTWVQTFNGNVKNSQAKDEFLIYQVLLKYAKDETKKVSQNQQPVPQNAPSNMPPQQSGNMAPQLTQSGMMAAQQPMTPAQSFPPGMNQAPSGGAQPFPPNGNLAQTGFHQGPPPTMNPPVSQPMQGSGFSPQPPPNGFGPNNQMGGPQPGGYTPSHSPGMGTYSPDEDDDLPF